MIPSYCDYNLLPANLSRWEDSSGMGDSLLGRWQKVWLGSAGARGNLEAGPGSGRESWAGDLHPELLSKGRDV